MITLDAQLNGGRFTQYDGFAFNSMVRFGEKFLGANSSGLHLIGADKDNGVDIAAEMELPTTDLGVQQKKRLRFLYFGYEVDGAIDVVVTYDQKATTTKTYRMGKIETSGQQRNRLPIRRDAHGRYLTLAVRNVAGSDFSLDSIDGLLVILSSGIMR